MSGYVHYNDYYKDVFLPEFYKAEMLIKSDLNSMNAKYKLCEEFIVLFETSFLLLKYYLHNNGLFQYTEAEVLREAFYIEFLDDAEDWMVLNKLVKNVQSYGIQEKFFPIVEEYFIKYFYVFKNLQIKFNGMV